MSPAWRGDRYAVFEDTGTHETLLVFRVSFDDAEDSARFCGQYGDALELKYKDRREAFKRADFYQFQTDTGGVFLHCLNSTSLVVEGGTRDIFDKINSGVGLAPAPRPSIEDALGRRLSWETTIAPRRPPGMRTPRSKALAGPP